MIRRLLLLVMLGQFLDAITFTLIMHGRPWAIGAELNPLAVLGYTGGGLLAVIAFKMAVPTFLTWLVGYSRWRIRKPPVWLTVMLTMAMVSGFIGFTANGISLIQLQAMGV